MRLRLGLFYGDLARRFGISITLAGQIFRGTVKVLSRVLRQTIVWLPRETIRYTLPQSFQESGYANTTCILDCTEVLLQRPKQLYTRSQTYSNCKGTNTCKFLVAAIAPSGYVMYVSITYGGRASDKVILEQCNIDCYLRCGDEVMADRGFTLTPELFAKGISLNVPAFTRGKGQLTAEEVTTRRIATLRIQVERLINRIKSYRILKGTFPISHRKALDDSIIVCAGLCNLKMPLIRDKQSA